MVTILVRTISFDLMIYMGETRAGRYESLP